MTQSTQKWQKLGVIFHVDGNHDWMHSHASFPKALVYPDKIRVFFTTRDKNQRGRVGYVDVDIDDPIKIIHVPTKPILDVGEPGTFDDCGVTPSSMLWVDNKPYMYYHGWNALQLTPHRLTTGLAIGDNQGASFQKYSKAPLFERTNEEPIFSNNPCVYKDGATWHMWYMCLEKWLPIADRLEGLFTLYYAHSTDGIHWQRDHVVAIPRKYEKECISNATVIKQNGLYKMWYSYRGLDNFRHDTDTAYRIGYAESHDAKNWVRLDEQVDLDENNKHDWETVMQAFPNVIAVNNKYYMFYNGNGFGKTGIGLACLDVES